MSDKDKPKWSDLFGMAPDMTLEQLTGEEQSSIVHESGCGSETSPYCTCGNDPERMEPLVHICESCGVEKVLTPAEAWNDGWDYPPMMGVFGIVSPRTCGKCDITTTLWWRIINSKKGTPYTLTDADRVVYERITGEPESIRPKERT